MCRLRAKAVTSSQDIDSDSYMALLIADTISVLQLKRHLTGREEQSVDGAV